MCRWLWIILNNKDSPLLLFHAAANVQLCWEVRAGVLHEEYADCDLLDEEAPATTWGRQGAPSASYLSLWRPETQGVSLIEGTVSINTNTKEVTQRKSTQRKSNRKIYYCLQIRGWGLLAAQWARGRAVLQLRSQARRRQRAGQQVPITYKVLGAVLTIFLQA